MSSASFSANGALPEYDGVELPHIERIMAAVSDICPPLVYPRVGPKDEPRLPFQAGRWTLGSNTGPGGEKLAPLTSAATHGHYFIGARWPTTQNAPQSVLWIPPSFPDCTYRGSPDRIGASRRQNTADLDTIRPGPAYPLLGLTAESSQADFPYTRTGAILLPWTVLVWGNSWADTFLLAHWIASKTHDLERSHPERLGEQFTIRNGGWTEDRPGDRGLCWKMTAIISAPIVRSEFSRAVPNQDAGTGTWEPPHGAMMPPIEGEPGP